MGLCKRSIIRGDDLYSLFMYPVIFDLHSKALAQRWNPFFISTTP